MKKIKFGLIFVIFVISISLIACTALEKGHSAKETANENADALVYKAIEYANRSKKGPVLIVIPGQIKSSNASFTQKVTANNIADFGELELSNANFKVLERADLGPVLNEISLAVNMGDPRKVRKILRRGKFKTTKWFVKFDVLKAEQVAEASTGANLGVMGRLLGMGIGGTAGAITGTAVGSVKTAEVAGVWLVGMRYKVIDANTTEQVTQGYFEEKMDVGKKATSVLGFSQGQKSFVTLDTLIQRLVQKAVSDLDAKK